jgi:hypothetical protein
MPEPWTDIQAQIEDADSYETTAEAAKDAAVKAFNYAASQCGLTGFQASWAALRFYGEVMGIKGPFAVFKAEDLLYPQYDLPGRFAEWMSSDEMRTWLADEAQKKIDESPGAIASVVAHWVNLIADRPEHSGRPQQGGIDA